MILRALMFVTKFAVLSVLVLVLGQIPVGRQSISDHVRDAVQHRLVQKPLHWISDRVSLTDGIRLGGNASKNARTDHAEKGVSREAGSEHPESEKGRLSGLLKRLSN